MNDKRCIFILLELNKAAVAEFAKMAKRQTLPIPIHVSLCHVILPLLPTSGEISFPWIWAGLVMCSKQVNEAEWCAVWLSSLGLKSPCGFIPAILEHHYRLGRKYRRASLTMSRKRGSAKSQHQPPLTRVRPYLNRSPPPSWPWTGPKWDQQNCPAQPSPNCQPTES